jgi:hypothetical protein
VAVLNIDSVLTSSQCTPETSRVQICNVRKSTISVDGPPGKVAAFSKDLDFLPGHKRGLMTAYGGICHAASVYDTIHVQEIVGDMHLDRTPNSPVISLANGRPYEGKTAKELFENIVQELLLDVVRWETNLNGAVKHARSLGASSCRIYEFRKSHPMEEQRTTLESNIPAFKASVEDIVGTMFEFASPENYPATALQAKLAIVGMSCRFPGGANDTDRFWDLLHQGLDVHRTVPPDRFDVSTHCDSEGKRTNATHTPYGCFIDEPGLFDAAFFNMSPREAEQTDPMHRLALVTAYEALEMAGHVNGQSIDTHRIGTFYGQAYVV